MKTLWVVVLTVGLAACGGKKGNKDVEDLKAFADSMCACKDRQCVEKVMADMTKAGEADKRPLSERMLEGDDQKAFDEQSKRYTKCSMDASGVK